LPEPIKIVCLYAEKVPADFDDLKVAVASCLNRIAMKPQRDVYVLTADEAKTEPTQLVPMHNTVSFMLKYISDNIDSEITLLKLSSISGYNADYLSDIFSRVTGESFKNYLNRCKTERIKQLMRDETLTLDEIAGRVSFCTRSYFNRFIKRETGLTPKQLRQKLTEGS
jgi:YesN/AraC family two-component response regulator